MPDPEELDEVAHTSCVDAECNVCRGDTHVIGPNPGDCSHAVSMLQDDGTYACEKCGHSSERDWSASPGRTG